jgi:hypothetical protein
MSASRSAIVPALVAVGLLMPGARATAQSDSRPAWLKDRGTGVPTSMFGSYVRRGEFLVYPFVELYADEDLEYKPEELGYDGDVDYRGEYAATEALIFLGYGLTADLALELEAAWIWAEPEKSPGAGRERCPAEL